MFKHATRWCSIVIFFSCLLLFQPSFVAHAAPQNPQGTWQQFTYWTAFPYPYNWTYSVYTPVNYHPGTSVPMVVMLPGCTQTGESFEDSTGSTLAADTNMDALADEKQFIVVYPQQNVLANPALCWNWFLEINEFRGSGEAAVIAGITQTVEHTTSQWTIDTHRVYAAGPSAGGAMSVIMGATYPDLFAAIGVESGPEYQAATSPVGYFTGGPDPTLAGDAAYHAMGSYARVVPVIDFQGTADLICLPINGDQVIKQWMETDHDASPGTYNASFADPSTTTYGQVPGGRSYTTYTWSDTNGNEVEEYWVINGMGHAWAGGSGLFGDPLAPSATLAMYNFFMRFHN